MCPQLLVRKMCLVLILYFTLGFHILFRNRCHFLACTVLNFFTLYRLLDIHKSPEDEVMEGR